MSVIRNRDKNSKEGIFTSFWRQFFGESCSGGSNSGVDGP